MLITQETFYPCSLFIFCLILDALQTFLLLETPEMSWNLFVLLLFQPSDLFQVLLLFVATACFFQSWLTSVTNFILCQFCQAKMVHAALVFNKNVLFFASLGACSVNTLFAHLSLICLWSVESFKIISKFYVAQRLCKLRILRHGLYTAAATESSGLDHKRRTEGGRLWRVLVSSGSRRSTGSETLSSNRESTNVVFLTAYNYTSFKRDDDEVVA